MSDLFSIRNDSLLMLKSAINDQNLSKFADLAVIQINGRWALIKNSDDIKGIRVQGQDLIQLMTSIANGAKEFPNQFKNLARDRKFIRLCRMVPGMETVEHLKSRLKCEQALRRCYEAAKVIGKGLIKIEKHGTPGRYVNHSYWIGEVVLRNEPHPMCFREIERLVEEWVCDTPTSLSFKEWMAAKKEKWHRLEDQGKTQSPFLQWLVGIAWESKEKNAWHEAHPQQSYDEASFKAWRRKQQDPKLFYPIWYLEELFGKKNKEPNNQDSEFHKTRNVDLRLRKRSWERFQNETGAFLTFEEHEGLGFEFSLDGSAESKNRWILRKLWEKSEGTDNLKIFACKLKWRKESSSMTFEEWSVKQEQDLMNKYKSSHLDTTLSFEKWKEQQDDSIWKDPIPFIHLEEAERAAYRIECQNGILMRNEHLYITQNDTIFVLGPDEDMYCGESIIGVFHHSSFLGDAAVAAAGGIKTNSSGMIVELSNRSGHYFPSDLQNLYMLKYFKERGADLTKVKFLLLNSDFKTEERNAFEYLQELEQLKVFGGI